MNFETKKLNRDDLETMHSLLDCFSEVFAEPENYKNKRPNPDYLINLLDSEMFISIVAKQDQKVIGGLAAYELKKFEQMRSEIYIYDLAVLKSHRRIGVATALINRLKSLAKARGSWAVIVQADYIDEPAVNLYSKLGEKEEVLHFHISVN